MNSQDRIDFGARTSAPIFFDMTISTILSIDSVVVQEIDAANRLKELRDLVSRQVCNQQEREWAYHTLEAYKTAMTYISAVRDVLTKDETLYSKYMHQDDALSAALNGFKRLNKN
ncbi:hypothetical protein [Vibrio crassostreae]|uniref:hypothetical protein n=1 Tax=Vibrio crassostreae TaxID=246167 RepID=UPI001B315DDE|nr:hypothetical protein [Vibrio crassostreae]